MKTVIGAIRAEVMDHFQNVLTGFYPGLAPASANPPFLTYYVIDNSPSGVVEQGGRQAFWERTIQIDLFQHEQDEDEGFIIELVNYFDGLTIRVDEPETFAVKLSVQSFQVLPSDRGDSLVHHEITITHPRSRSMI